MTYQNGYITSPVSINDVRQALGESTTDLGRLCKSSKVNMWCKWKPVSYPSFSETDKSKLGEGISYSNMEDTPESIALSSPGSFSWSWDMPTGGVNSPYRLTDFQGYNTACICPAKIKTFDETWGDRSQVAAVEVKTDSELPTGNVSVSGVFSKSDGKGNYRYGDYRVTLAITDINATKVFCYLFAEEPLKYNIFGFNATQKTEVTALGRALKDKYKLTNNTIYRGVLMLTNYPGSNFDMIDFDPDLILGATPEEMNSSGANGVALELEAGINQFSFTFHKSYLDDQMRAYLYSSGMNFYKQVDTGNRYKANIYKVMFFDFYANYNLAHLLATQGEWKLEYRVYSYHQPVSYPNNLGSAGYVPDGDFVYDRTYTVIPWNPGTNLIAADDGPDYTENTPSYRYWIDVTWALPHIDVNIKNGSSTNTERIPYAPILFDSSDSVHEVYVYFWIRQSKDNSTAVIAAYDHMQARAGQNYFYEDESVRPD